MHSTFLSFSLTKKLTTLFDQMNVFWEKHGTQRKIAFLLFWIYLASLLGIELFLNGLYPDFLPTPPKNHFAAIHLAFSLILILELISLIFIIPESLSVSIGIQFEILTLILLRNAFKELTTFEEPIMVQQANLESLCTILVSALGALLVFICLGIYKKIIKHPHFIHDIAVRQRYIQDKKLIALALLCIFVVTGCHTLYTEWQTNVHQNFFETIYNVLIFADIGIVLISQRYMTGYYAVFRNSGFVMGTLIMRLSLAAPPLWSPLLGLLAALFVLGLTYGTNKYIPSIEKQEIP